MEPNCGVNWYIYKVLELKLTQVCISNLNGYNLKRLELQFYIFSENNNLGYSYSYRNNMRGSRAKEEVVYLNFDLLTCNNQGISFL